MSTMRGIAKGLIVPEDIVAANSQQKDKIFYCPAGMWIAALLLFFLGLLAGCTIPQYSGAIREAMTNASPKPSSYLKSALGQQIDWTREHLAKGRSEFAAWLDRAVPAEGGYWHCLEQDESVKCLLKDKIRG